MDPSVSCLNCGAPIEGNFCSNCGQAVIHSKLTVWQLIGQFFSSTFNYDGRLIRSIKMLLFHPAALTQAYISGKRRQFVNPVQFYLFSSAIYFLIAGAMPTAPLINFEDTEATAATSAQNENEIEVSFESFEAYMAHQKTLDPEEQNSEFELLFVRKFYELQSDYKTPKAIISAIGTEIYARIPQLLIITLPLLALLSKLLFIRQRHYWYIDHLIFVLHITTSLFILMILTRLLSFVSTKTETSAFSMLGVVLNMSWLGYYLISLKRFFNKNWMKSVLYFLALGSLQGLVVLLAFLVLFTLSFLQL